VRFWSGWHDPPRPDSPAGR